MKINLLRLLVIYLVIGASPLVHALTTDKDKPIDVVADQVDVDDKTGISTFHGKVHVTRGSLHITGDIVVVHRNKDNEVETIIATGNRAIYRQRPDNKPADVVARALKINYDAIKEIVTLHKKGEIVQDKDTFTGEQLVYYAKADKVSASGGKESSGGRVHMTLQPSNKQK